jgi:hypothetical protein
MWEAAQLLKLHNLDIDRITIQSDLQYRTGGNVAGAYMWNLVLGSTWSTTGGFLSRPGNDPAFLSLLEMVSGL